jgi:hypothetical protein
VAAAQIKNYFNSIGELDASVPPSALVLKLTVSTDFLRYFVLSKTHQQVIFFGDYTLHHITTPEALAVAIQKIFEKDEILQMPFSRALVGFDEAYALVPSGLSNLVQQGQMSTRCAGTDIVYEAPPKVAQTLRSVLNNPEFLHLNSTYFKFLPEYLDNSLDRLFVNVGRGHADVIYFDSGKELQLMNRYDYSTASDFIYFVLLCCEQLKFDRENAELVLMGEVDIQSKIYELCYRYFRNIRFIPRPSNLHFTNAFEIYPKHLHFNLYNLTSCES